MTIGTLILSLIFFCLPLSEAWAPEVTAPTGQTYDTFRVGADGRICDHHGVIRGWIHQNTLYDSRWNRLYSISNGRLTRTGSDEQ